MKRGLGFNHVTKLTAAHGPLAVR